MLISKIRSETRARRISVAARARRKSAALINTVLCPAVLPLVFIGNTWPGGSE